MNQFTKRRTIIVVIVGIIFAAALASAAAPFPKQQRIQPNAAKATDLNRNGIPETYALTNGRLTIAERPTATERPVAAEQQKIIWRSPAEWHIDSVHIADSDNDGIPDVNISLWKPGNFGLSKPFWIKHNDMRVRNHLFIYDLVGDKLTPRWQSSNLERPNCALRFEDIDHDGRIELIVTEGTYKDAAPLTAIKPLADCTTNTTRAIWRWNIWGFMLDRNL